MTVSITTFFMKCHYSGCRNVECRYTECRYAECRGAVLSQFVIFVTEYRVD
jgi:hypothetical protein